MQPELENYIKENLAKGLPKDQIRQDLLQKGWKAQDIDSAFSQLEVPPSPPLSSLPPFPINQPSAPTPPIQPKEKKPLSKLLNSKVLIILIVIITVSLAGGGSYLYLSNKIGLSNTNPSSKTPEESSQNIIFQEGDLKTCPDVPPPNIPEPETNLEAKFVLHSGGNKETRILDINTEFNTQKEIVLDHEHFTPSVHFSPDGKYIIGIQNNYQEQEHQNVKEIFLFDTATETKKGLTPTFEVGLGFDQNVMWSEDGRQFIISQQSNEWKKDSEGHEHKDFWVNYFNVEDLTPHQTQDFSPILGKSNISISQYSNEKEIIFVEELSPINYKFSTLNLINGNIESKNISLDLPSRSKGKFTPDYKYYVFAEEDKTQPKNADDVLKQIKAYIGYVNVEQNCVKKREITEFPTYYATDINLEQFSEDSQKAHFSLTTLLPTSTYINLLINIPSLNTSSREINTIINGDQINSIITISPLFNYAIFGTVNDKTYLMNLKTGETTLIMADKSSTRLWPLYPSWFWLKEVPK